LARDALDKAHRTMETTTIGDIKIQEKVVSWERPPPSMAAKRMKRMCGQ
jgi:hypothetical protein